MKLLISHPTGNTFVRALIEYSHNIGVLDSFHTTIAYRDGHWTNRLVPGKIRTQLKRRGYPVPDNMIRRHPFRETVRLLASKLGLAPLTRHGEGWASMDEVYRELDLKTAATLENSDASHLHCYEDGALASFKEGRERGLHLSYELPIAYWKKMHTLLAHEAERLPHWAPTLITTGDSPEKLDRKDKELELADTVVVPSQFVMDSLPQEILTGKRCVRAPFGTPQTDLENIKHPISTNGRVRFLFAGSMGQRKGLGDVLLAFSNIQRKDVELVVMGTPMMEMEFYRKEFSEFIYEPPRSHAQVLELMQSCHVLVLPSIVEGRALVQQEAMSQGMALLVTPNAGGEDLVKEGITGFLVHAGNPRELVEKIEWFADHPETTQEMGQNAKSLACDYSWEKYAIKILNGIEGNGRKAIDSLP